MDQRNLTETEATLLGRIENGRHIPVRGREAEIATMLADEFRPPLVATGSMGETLVIGITAEGREAWLRHREMAAAPDGGMPAP